MNREALINELLSQYQQERLRAEREADEMRQKIAEKAPIYRNFEQEMMKAVRQGLAAADDDPEAGKKAIYALRDEARRQLKAAGYQQEDLEPRYRCQDCKDTGYVGMPVHEFCHCFKRRLSLLQMKDEDVSLPPGHSFAAFDESIFPVKTAGGFAQKDFMGKAKRAFERYSDGFGPQERRSILLYGESGLGKTFLLDCVVRAIVEKGYSAMRLTAYRLGELMRKKHFGEDEESVFDRCLEVDFLAVDDLGSEPMIENVTVVYLYAIISERTSAGRPTMLSTNLNLTELAARYTERIFSRLVVQPNIVMKLEGEDIRHGVAQKQR